MKSLISKILFIFIFLLFSDLLQAQNNNIKKDSIYIYSVNNDNFSAILDSFLTHESQYKYFKDGITFGFNILDSNGTCFQLTSGSKIDILEIIENEIKDNCGVFYFNSFRFFICGRSKVDKRILKRENKKIMVNRTRLINEPKLIGEDDRYFPTTWIYIFNNDKFYSTWKSDMIDNR